MIFNINSTRGQTRFPTCVARVTCSTSNLSSYYNLYFFDKASSLPLLVERTAELPKWQYARNTTTFESLNNQSLNSGPRQPMI